ncbi:MAG: hypothetical protein AAF497_16595 [Planctomycetota bacterium]
MRIQDFLAHHKIKGNPFAEEDAQTDAVFKNHCISSTYHPAWDKVYGSPADPSTSIVFGEKGAGKTALRLQVEKHIEQYNLENPEDRCFVVAYDDFNPILDQFRERVGRRSRRPEKTLQQFQLWDHMDAILSLATTKLVSAIIEGKSPTGTSGITTKKADEPAPIQGHSIPKNLRKRLDKQQRRDLMLLATCYDNTAAAPLPMRWSQLRSRIGGGSWSSWWPFNLGWKVSALVLATLIAFWVFDMGWVETMKEKEFWATYVTPYWWAYPLIALLGWLPWLYRSGQRWLTAMGITRRLRVIERRSFPLSRMLMRFGGSQLARQPLPNKDRTDDRYSLLAKLQGILKSLGFKSMVVLVDRLDEPHMINGSADAMKALLWPMLDNKFLKQEGLAIKFLLPIELQSFIQREGRDFNQRARLDKQNVVPSLRWTGQALYDVANARLAACAEDGAKPKLADIVDETLTLPRIFDALQGLRVPRHVFKFLYRVISEHCNRHSDNAPEYRIAGDTFESELGIYKREMEVSDRNLAG